MTILREEKLRRIAANIPDAEVVGDEDGDLLVVGWGGTYSAIRAGVNNVRKGGYKVAHLHLRHLAPLPANVGELVRRFPKVLVPELNRGQLATVLRAEYLVDVISYPKVQGLPFKTAEISGKIIEILDAKDES
jgi:2-oxoglutarate ferredoxin oxidoreductase subunit alpha